MGRKQSSSTPPKVNVSQEEEDVEVGATGGTQIKKEVEKALSNNSSQLSKPIPEKYGSGDTKLKKMITSKDIEFEE